MAPDGRVTIARNGWRADNGTQGPVRAPGPAARVKGAAMGIIVDGSPSWCEATARVLVVDDHAVFAETLAGELQRLGFEVLDLYLGPEVGTSVPLIAPLVASGAEVVILTGMTDEAQLAGCVEAGASGVVSKVADLEAVFDAVVHAAHHERLQPTTERERMLAVLRGARRQERARLERFERLTRRERVVLAGLMDGLSAAEIAESSFVSLTTVRSQIRAVLLKLGVTSQLAAVAAAHRAGWTFDDMDAGHFSGAVAGVA
jgi:two-component system nitrate/nitrite response regulator NarL